MRIIKYPHPTLRHKSKPLRRVDAELKRMIAEMLDLMYADRGVGLAANQVNLPYRVVVMNVESDPTAKDQEYVFINPVIIKRGGGTSEAEEGCLSLPEIYAPVKRSETIELATYNLAGESLQLRLSGLFARAAQHEIDHLDGMLFIDRLSPTAKLSVKDEVEGLEATFQGERDRGQIPSDQDIAARLAELEKERT